MDAEEKRAYLKEMYKKQFREEREIKKKINEAQRIKNIRDSLHEMEQPDMFHAMGDFVDRIKTRVAKVEARLEVALNSLLNESRSTLDDAELEDLDTRNQARNTLKEIKMEMGILYTEMEEQAKKLTVDKTVGPAQQANESSTTDTESKG